jgi:N-acetylhexosamine 1-kinase
MARNSEAAHLEEARDIASCFDLPGPIQAFDFPGKGNINRKTYLISAGRHPAQYLLQQLNPGVFTRPQAVMETMIACIKAQEAARSGSESGAEWETIRLVPTRDGQPYLQRDGETGTEFWRLMVRISDTLSFRSLREIESEAERLRVAEEAGKGLALFGALTSRMDASQFECPLPGYRDTELYYSQLFSILAGSRTLSEAEPYLPPDSIVRNSTAALFTLHIDHAEYRRRLKDPELRKCIEIAVGEKAFGLALSAKLKSGELKKELVHGDTKLDNFLFSSRTGKVKALVDLDTVMPHTWLSDWGDMVRSLVNIAGERERDLEKVQVNPEISYSLAKGFLGSARHAVPEEIGLMSNAPAIMALELAIRFLADYLRGDVYFGIGPGEPEDLNKVRAMVQFRLFELLRSRKLL